MRTNIQLKQKRSDKTTFQMNTRQRVLGGKVFFYTQKKHTHTKNTTKDSSFVLFFAGRAEKASDHRWGSQKDSTRGTRKHKARPKKYTIEIWLILPVVICLFQGLSHACLRITALQESAHGSLHQTQSAAKMLRSPQNWISWRNAKLIHESMWVSSVQRGDFGRRSEAPCE